MHFKGFNLNQLVSLDALLTEKSVTRAAERLNITQPAMSAALSQLREYLSDPLLEKVGGKFELTPRGRELQISVRELLLQIDTVLRFDQNFEPETAVRTFKVAMSAHMADLLGAPLIRHLIKHAPMINFQIVDLAHDSLRAVEDGELDFCISVVARVESNPPHRPEVLSSCKLLSDEFVLVAAKDNDNVGLELSYEQFCELPYVEVRFSGNFKSLPEIELEMHAHRPHVHAWLPTSQNVLAAVSATMAVAIVPRRLFMRHQKSLGLKCIAPPLRLPMVHQKCFWHVRNNVDRGHQWFLETIQEVIADT